MMRNERSNSFGTHLTVFVVLGLSCVGMWFFLIPMFQQLSKDKADNATAQALVNHTADVLATKRAGAGYDREAGDAVTDLDPWGTKIEVFYPVSGVIENFSVKSAGKDKQFGSQDDLVASKGAFNISGIGAGLRDNAGKVTNNVVEGAFTGAANGAVKATGIIKDALKGEEKKEEEKKTGD